MFFSLKIIPPNATANKQKVQLKGKGQRCQKMGGGADPYFAG
jgi:hypothetical protein